MAVIKTKRTVPLEALKPYENNARTHSEEQVGQIADSITEFGFLNPILIDTENNIIAGHGRYMAAQRLGMTSVPCLQIEGLSDEQRRAYILADNRLTELGGWDRELVSNELQDLKDAGFDIDLTGFDIDDIVISDDMGPDISEEELEERTAAEPRIKRGEVWILGRHRLMCGDSTDHGDCQKLMGGGSVDLLLTDPPYGISYEGGTDDHMAMENDDLIGSQLYEFLKAAFTNAEEVMRQGAPFYVWYASANTKAFTDALLDSGLSAKEELIWVKQTWTLGRQDYQWRHEPCIYGWKEGAAHYFIGLRSLSTVEDDIDRLTREQAIERIKELSAYSTAIYENKPVANRLHPTMKPLSLFKKLIRNSSKTGDVVLDLFGGSGTTLIAAEQMDRTCYMMEYDPHYAEVIIQRWEELTGRKATLAEN